MTGLRGAGVAGHLVIVGGHEDRKDDKVILSRFVDLAGGPEARIFVLTAASRVHDDMWAIYDQAFGDLGVAHRETARIESRSDAMDPSLAERVRTANAIFMTGGDQRRLIALIGGTPLAQAMHDALRDRGAAIGGTSAGAAAMAQHMLVDGTRELLPQKGAVHLAPGLGFLKRTIVDQHFSERQRLGRLLSGVAQNPYLFGAGIDEDTALIVQPGVGIEVIGQGAVTLVDGREMESDFSERRAHELLELADVRLHLLPGGTTYDAPDTDAVRDEETGARLPRSLADAVRAITGGSGSGAGADAPERHDDHDEERDR